MIRFWPRRKSDPTIVALVGQLSSAEEAARMSLAVLCGEISIEEAMHGVEEIESAGDDARATLVEELTAAIGPPIDHEDMFRVSRSVDDVLDNLRDFVHELSLFRAEHLTGLIPPLEPTAEALGQLSEAIRMFDKDPKAVIGLCLQAQRTAGHVRRSYQKCLADLFTQESVTVDMLRSRELLRRLDVIGLRLQEATAALSDGLMKRGLT